MYEKKLIEMLGFLPKENSSGLFYKKFHNCNNYIIEIDLPEGLKTLYGKKLDFAQNMQGTAEIITEDIHLLQKIINPFRYIISKNKR